MAKPKPRPRPTPKPRPRPTPRPRPKPQSPTIGQRIDKGVAATKKFLKPAVREVKKVYKGDLSNIRKLERKVSGAVGRSYVQQLGFKGKNKFVNRTAGRALGAATYNVGKIGYDLAYGDYSTPSSSYSDQKRDATGR